MPAPTWWSGITTFSPLVSVLALAKQWAASDLTILLVGETGTGKSMVARQMHAWSGRASAPLIEVECGGVPDSLVEREFFGSEKGAFTGATGKAAGHFTAAQRGTLLLDDVQALSPRAQTCLLGVLDTHTVCPVGSTRRVAIDVRTMATSNQCLPDLIAHQQFRLDLYHRLNHVILELPPLRHDPTCIVPLATQWLTVLCAAEQRPLRSLDARAQDRLRSYAWPGNLRELVACLRRAVLCCTGTSITVVDLFGAEMTEASACADASGLLLSYADHRYASDRRYCQQLLHQTDGDLDRAQRTSGLSLATLYRLLSRVGLTATGQPPLDPGHTPTAGR